MDTTNRLNVFALSGETGNKDSLVTPFRQQYPQLFSLLDATPIFAFSPTGIRNICNRFRISRQTLELALLAYTRPDELTEEEERAVCFAPILCAPTKLRLTPKRGKGGTSC